MSESLTIYRCTTCGIKSLASNEIRPKHWAFGQLCGGEIIAVRYVPDADQDWLASVIAGIDRLGNEARVAVVAAFALALKDTDGFDAQRFVEDCKPWRKPRRGGRSGRTP